MTIRLIFLLWLLVPLISNAQHIITGRVVCCSTQTPILITGVRELNTFNHAMTWETGHFQLTTSRDSATIIIMGYSQAGITHTAKEILVVSDTSLEICLMPSPIIYEFVNMRGRRWITIGLSFDLLNGYPGLTIGNGLDERTLIHFEDIRDRLLVRITGHYDFREDYAIKGAVAWHYIVTPLDPRMEYRRQLYSRHKHLFGSLSLTTGVLLKSGRTQWVLNVSGGYQSLNKVNNPGGALGLECNLHGKGISLGFMHGYWFDYSTWEVFARGFLLKKSFGVGVTYERIDRFEMLNAGLFYTFPRKRKAKNNRE